MDSRLFESKLTSHKMFKDLKDCFTESTSNKLTNLLELKDDVFYVWNPAESCLMCLNLKHLEEHGDETPYQKLHMVSPPSFAVERVVASACGSRVCVWGARGVCVAELPARWGRAGLFDSGNQSILCKSWCVDERLLYCQGEVRRVHWHPDSLSHLIVLVSDNTLRVYNIAMKGGPKLVKCVSVGPKPAGALAGRALLDSLGDTAVDFTPVPDSRDLLVLRGNGDLYLVSAQLEQLSGGAKVVRGPLAMYPPADDNYGSESCSVACVGGGADPPLVVVATCSAQLYHCLLLPNPECECEADSHALYVIEAVELAVPAADALHSYPVQLLPCSSSSYVCVHAGGVHTVSLPMLGHLAELAAVDDERAEGVVVSLLGARSGARHAVRTRRAAGLALSRPPLPALLLLTEAGELLYRTLEPFELEEQLYRELQLRNPALEQRDRDQLLDERARLSFSALMLEILRRDVSQPVLRLAGGRDPDPAQCLEVVSEATLKLRSEYMSRQARAAAAARDKLAALATRAARHRAWLHTLQGEAEEVRAAAAALRDKCLLAEKHQDDLQYRCSAAARRVRGGAPTGAERALLAELAEARRRAQHHAHQLAALRQLVAARNQQLKTWKEDYKRKDLALGKSHSDSIASVLQQQTSQISSLIEETKLLKDQLSIV